MPIASGTFIGPYEVIAPIGVGGMGEVYRARDARLAREVAIKVLPSSATLDAERIRRFEQEARAASALNHPNIITIHEIGEADAGRYIVMELVRGRTFRSIPRPVSIDAFIGWARQAAEALGVAHSAGIVHRDIKPENLMVREDGYVKILDFGLARLSTSIFAQGGIEGATMTDPGTLLGTIRYMSPEQTRSLPATSASDVFGLGVVLYELAAGQHPFAAGTLLAVLDAITSARPIEPSRLNRDLSPAFDAIILKMLEKDPNSRPTAQEVEIELVKLEGRVAVEPSRTLHVAAPICKTVGRSSELEELREAYQEASTTRGLLVSIAGEPGIGKTTLVEDFLTELEMRDEMCAIARGRCSERLAATEAYLPILEALSSLLRYESSRSLARTVRAGFASIAQNARNLAPTWYAQVAPLPSSDPSSEKLMADLKSASPERMKLELLSLIVDTSRRQPLVLFFDDLHWADVSTIDLLAYLASKFDEMRVLIIVTYRPSAALLAKHPFLSVKRNLQSHGLCREISPQFLTLDEVREYLNLEFPGHSFPDDLPNLIHSKTEGSPLFMSDLVRYLRDRKVIARDPTSGGLWKVVRSLPEIEKELPASVRAMIEEKIGQLSDEDRRLLVTASVQGSEFDSAVVSRVLEADPADVEERLEVLQRVYAFIRQVGERDFPDRTLSLRYRFVHVLYQNALYSSLGPTRRVSLNSRVASALRSLWGDHSPTVASRLARLYEAAREFENAAEFYYVAAERSANVLANREAELLARRGLDMLDNVDNSARRVALELKLQLALGFAVIYSQGSASEEAGRRMRRACELCEQMGETPQLFPAVWGLWWYFTVGGHIGEARQMAERLLRFALQVNNSSPPPQPMLLVGARFALGFNFLTAGELKAACAEFDQARAIYDPGHHFAYRLLYRSEPGIASYSFSIRALWMLGYPDRARKRMDETLELTDRVNDPHDRAFSRIMGAGFLLVCDEAQRAADLCRECIEISTEFALDQERHWASVWLGRSLVQLGEVDEGLKIMRESLDAQRRLRSQVSATSFLNLLAEGLLAAGNYKEGLSVVAEALDLVESSGEAFYKAELYRIKGNLILGQASENAVIEAEKAFQVAANVAREQEAKSWELRAVMDLGRLWLSQGKAAEARQRISEVYNWFTEGHDTADLKAARSLLETLH